MKKAFPSMKQNPENIKEKANKFNYMSKATI